MDVSYLMPQTAFFEVTSNCDLACAHCINDTETEEDLDYSDVAHILCRLKRAGIKLIKFTGGEPFLRPDFYDVLHLCERLELGYIVYTNGLNYDAKLLRDFKYMRSLRISVDGFEDGHDSVRGDGTFRRVMDRLRANLPMKGGPKIELNYTINRANYRQLLCLDQYLDAHRIDVGIHIGFIKYAGRALKNKALLFSMEDSLAALDELGRIISMCRHIEAFSMLSDEYISTYISHFGCPAGREAIFVASNGNVYPCGMFKNEQDFLCGNLLRESFEAVLSSEAIQTMNRLECKSESCACCEIYGTRCSGACRGNAYHMLGNLASEDINCCFYRLQK